MADIEATIKNQGFDDLIGQLLRRAARHAQGHLAQRLGPYDLTPIQFVVLARLAEIGPVSQNRLGRLVAMEQSNIHGVIYRLQLRGLVERSIDPTDKRLAIVSLTRTARLAMQKLVPLATAANETTLAPFTHAERDQLLALLRRLLRARPG